LKWKCPVDPILEVVKGWGPPGALALLMWVMLKKSEERESKKDIRIQLLENQLIESYDERVSAADRIGDAIHLSANAAANAAKALDGLANEVRAKR
jgi:hypothetical protein